jgi:hypothetical protein
MLTSAEVKILANNRIQLEKDGTKLILLIQQTEKVVMKTWSTDPPEAYDAPNPGTTLVGFEIEVPKNSNKEITVLLIPQGGEAVSTKNIMPLQNWSRSVVK